VLIDGGWSANGEKLVELVQDIYCTDQVELVILTHPDDDHSNGLFPVLEGLNVGQLAMHLPWNHTEDIARMFGNGRVTDASVKEKLRRSLDSACELSQLAKQKGIQVVEPFAGDHAFGGALRILGPSRDYYRSLLPHFRDLPQTQQGMTSFFQKAASGLGEFVSRVAESFDIETLSDSSPTSAENNSSVITLVRVDGHGLLFTGDAGIDALSRAADQLESLGFDYKAINCIQVPHHGSRKNVGPTVLNRLVGPKLPRDNGRLKYALCSCPKDSEKHPARKATNAFRRRGTYVYPTRGHNLRYFHEAAARPSYQGTISPIELFSEVEDD